MCDFGGPRFWAILGSLRVSSQYSGDLKSNHLKSGTNWNPDFLKVGFQMIRFSNSRALAINHSKIWTFLSGFQMVFDKMAAFVRISNGWASGFQIPFEIQTICNPTCFGPFEIQTRSDFRSPLYTVIPTWVIFDPSLHNLSVPWPLCPGVTS